MDTHITDADLGHAGVGLTSPIGLPGEGNSSPEPSSTRERLGATASPEAASPAEASTHDPAVPNRRIRRSALLAGVAVVVLIGAGGTGLYAFRDDIRNGNLTHKLTAMISGSVNNPPAAPMEAGVTARPGIAIAPAKPVRSSDAAHVTPAAPTDSAATLAREFATLQSFSKAGDLAPVALEAGVTPPPLTQGAVPPPGTVSRTAQVAIPPAPMPTLPQTSTPVQQEASVVHAVTPSEASKVMPAAASAATALSSASPGATPVTVAPVTTTPQAAPAPAPAHAIAPREPVNTAAELKAGPMTSTQQVEVVGLIKSLGAQLRDTRVEVDQLHRVVVQLSENVESRTTDFENRLGLAEASAIVQSSARAGSGALSSEATASPPPPASIAQSNRVASARNAVPLPAAAAQLPERRTVKDYVVKGASPGLAVLAALNPMSGSGNVIEVAIGDSVPGVGRVKRVYQRGTTWIVETESGSIQQ